MSSVLGTISWLGRSATAAATHRLSLICLLRGLVDTSISCRCRCGFRHTLCLATGEALYDLFTSRRGQRRLILGHSQAWDESMCRVPSCPGYDFAKGQQAVATPTPTPTPHMSHKFGHVLQYLEREYSPVFCPELAAEVDLIARMTFASRCPTSRPPRTCDWHIIHNLTSTPHHRRVKPNTSLYCSRILHVSSYPVVYSDHQAFRWSCQRMRDRTAATG